MRNFVLSLLVIATAASTIAVPLFAGHGIASRHGGPFLYSLGFLILACALAFGTARYSRADSRTHAHGRPSNR